MRLVLIYQVSGVQFTFTKALIYAPFNFDWSYITLLYLTLSFSVQSVPNGVQNFGWPTQLCHKSRTDISHLFWSKVQEIAAQTAAAPTSA